MSLFLLWHIGLSALLGLIFSVIFGNLSVSTAALALGLGAIASYFISRADASSKTLFIDPKDRSSEVLWLERVAVIFVSCLCYRHFVYLFYPVGTDLKTLNVNNFGDLPLHINYIRHIAFGGNFPWVNPSFSTELLRYPIGIDLYNALWEAIGVRLSAHLFFVGMIGSWLSIRFVRMAAGWWGVVGLFLSGGVLGVMQADLAWKNFFLAIFVTQRGFLFALPAGIYLILRARRPEKLSWTFGLLWGILAIFHLHTFAIVSLILAGESLLRRDPKKFLTPLALALPIGSSFVLYALQGVRKSSFVRWQAGWMAEGSLIKFLVINFGLYLWFAIGTFVYLLVINFVPKFKRPDQVLRPLFYQYTFYLLLFFIFFNFIVAPWAWDNMKVLIWPYLLMLGCWNQLSTHFRLRGWQTVVALTLSLPGLQAVTPSLVSTAGSAAIYSRGELANAESALKDVPSDAVFLAATTHHHPLTYFGRVRALGYVGHLWSHGINSEAEQKLVERIFNGDPEWRDLAQSLGVTHIYWGKDERSQYGAKPHPWMDSTKNISPVEEIGIYAVK